ncbi:MAG TPA: hypothetical protein VF916_04280 [Ktedonobacterales bacterium]
MWWSRLGGDIVDSRRTRGAGASRWLVALALACAALLVGCGGPATAHRPNTQTPSPPTALASPSVVASPTAIPTAAAPTPVAIQDLGAFRQKLTDAVTGKDWAGVQALLSPDFSFQAPKAGSHLLMPDAAQYLQASFQAGVPWDQYPSIPFTQLCYAGPTPLAQVISFNGNNGHFLMIGVTRWNGTDGYWVAAWAFENPQNVQWDCSCGCIND